MRLKHRPFSGALFVVAGLLLVLAGVGGSWGVAYGQSAGPTPTVGVVSPIQAQKSVSPSSGQPGDLLTFSIDVRNDSDTPQTNVIVADDILDFLEIVSVSTTKGTASFSGQQVEVVVGTLAPGEVATITIVVRIRQSAQSGDTGTNIALVSGDEGGNTTVTPTNPVAVSVDQGSPGGLPDTGAAAETAPWMLGLGGLLMALGALIILKQRRRLI